MVLVLWTAYGVDDEKRAALTSKASMATLGSFLEEESYPVLKDLSGILVFAIIFPVLRYTLDRQVFEKQGRKHIYKNAEKVMSGLSEDDKEALSKRLIKFKESCWKCSYYTLAFIFAMLATFGEPWAFNSRLFWMGPGDRVWPDQTMKTKLKLLYNFVGGFYSYSIFALIFWETRRKDFGVSMSHHIAAVALIVFSYMARFGRICSIVVALHDVSDVFLEMAKLNKYLEVEVGATIFFALFAISWLLMRILYFPMYIIRSTSFEVLQVLDKSAHEREGPFLYYVFNTLLIMLLVMHVYWFVLILRVILKQLLASGQVDDVRSDDEDE